MSYIEMMAKYIIDTTKACKRCPAFHVCENISEHGRPIDYDEAIECQERDKRKDKLYHMNKEQLSKIKHIHKIYLGGDGILHCEKYPVVYINKNYTYFKEYNNPSLNHTDTSRVHDTIDDFLIDKMSRTVRLPYLTGYVWNMDDYSSEYMAGILAKIHNKQNQTRRENLLNRAKYHKIQYETAMAELEEMEKEE